MSVKNCFKKSKNKELKSLFSKKLKEGLSEEEAAVNVIKEYAESLGGNMGSSIIRQTRNETTVTKVKSKRVRIIDGEPIKTLTEKGARNRVYDLFKTALVSPVLYDNMMTSIDNNTIKHSMTELLKEKKLSPLGVFSPIEAIDTLFAYKAGAAGIGEWANSNNDHIRAQDLDITLTSNLGNWGNTTMDQEFSETLTKEELSTLIRDINAFRAKKKLSPQKEENLSKIRIGDSLSELINAFVDIANEDAFVTRANWGTMLNGYGGMLLRAGVHPHKIAATFLQPSMSEFIKEVSYAEGVITNIPSYEILDEKLDEYFKKIEVKYEEDFGVKLKGEDLTDYRNNLNTSTFDWLYKADSPLGFSNFRDMAKGNIIPSTLEELSTQYMVLAQYKAHKDIVKRYNAAVISSKWGENGAGTTPASLLLAENKLSFSFSSIERGVGKGMEMTGLDRKYMEADGTSKLLMTYYQNTAKTATRIFDENSRLFFGANSIVFEGINKISDENRVEQYLSNEETANNMLLSVKALALSSFKPFNKKYSKERREAITKRIVKLRAKGDNFFLKSLYYEIEGDDIYFFMNRVSSKDGYIKDKLSDSWEQLLNSDKPSIREAAEFLVNESYKTSGFAPGPRRFFELIPPIWLHKKGLTNYIEGIDYNGIMDIWGEQYSQNTISHGFFRRINGGSNKIRIITDGDKNIDYIISNTGNSINIGFNEKLKLPIMPKYVHFTKNKVGVLSENSGLDKISVDYLPLKLMGLRVEKSTKKGKAVTNYKAVYKALKNAVEEDETVNVVKYNKNIAEASTNIDIWKAAGISNPGNAKVAVKNTPMEYYERIPRVNLSARQIYRKEVMANKPQLTPKERVEISKGNKSNKVSDC